MVSFTNLWYLPYTHAKVQATELLSLPLFFGGLHYLKPKLFSNGRLWIPLGLYLLSNLISTVFGMQSASWFELLGRFYLALLFVVIWAYAVSTPSKTTVQLLAIWEKGALALAFIALIGYGFSLLGWPNANTQVYLNYPYFGSVLRAKGFTNSPAMLNIVVGLPFLWVWYKWRVEGKGSWRLLLLGLVLVLSFSKELILLILGILLLEPSVQKWGVWKKNALFALSSLVFIVGTHWVILFQPSLSKTSLDHTQYISGKAPLEVGPFYLAESSYLSLKKANFIIGLRHPGLGVGPGAFNRELENLKREKLYPSHLPDYDPHSSWAGAWSETGALGFLCLLLLYLYWGRLIARTNDSPENQVIKVFLLLVLINSISTDVMNIRQIWLASALILAESPLKQDK